MPCVLRYGKSSWALIGCATVMSCNTPDYSRRKHEQRMTVPNSAAALRDVASQLGWYEIIIIIIIPLNLRYHSFHSPSERRRAPAYKTGTFIIKINTPTWLGDNHGKTIKGGKRYLMQFNKGIL